MVHELALNMVNSSAAGDEQSVSEAYSVLKDPCLTEEGDDLDHPLQWEALGDFSGSHSETLGVYQKDFPAQKISAFWNI